MFILCKEATQSSQWKVDIQLSTGTNVQWSLKYLREVWYISWCVVLCIYLHSHTLWLWFKGCSCCNISQVHNYICTYCWIICRLTETKHVILIMMFPPKYPHEPLVVECKSKTLSDKLMRCIEKICKDKAEASWLGQKQVNNIFVLKLAWGWGCIMNFGILMCPFTAWGLYYVKF